MEMFYPFRKKSCFVKNIDWPNKYNTKEKMQNTVVISITKLHLAVHNGKEGLSQLTIKPTEVKS